MSQKEHNLKKNAEHKMFVLILSNNLSETFLILRRNERDIIKNVFWSSCKVLFIIVKFNEILNSLTDFREVPSSIKFYENPLSGNRVVTYGRTDGQADRRKDGQKDRRT
jgi:hypothetical protein